MTWLTKNIRTKVVILNDNREFHITQDQYVTLKLKLEDSKFSDPLVISDPDTWEIMFDGKVSAIKEFKHKRIPTHDNKNWYWICNYWIKHKVDKVTKDFEICNCMSKIKIIPQEFFKRLKEMWYWELLSYEVTNEIIRDYKKKYFINWN